MGLRFGTELVVAGGCGLYTIPLVGHRLSGYFSCDSRFVRCISSKKFRWVKEECRSVRKLILYGYRAVLGWNLPHKCARPELHMHVAVGNDQNGRLRGFCKIQPMKSSDASHQQNRKASTLVPSGTTAYQLVKTNFESSRCSFGLHHW